MVRAVHSFCRLYRGVRTDYDVYDMHFRLNCLLAMFVRLKPCVAAGEMDFTGVDLQQFEINVLYAVRCAMSELCCYFKTLCKCVNGT